MSITLPGWLSGYLFPSPSPGERAYDRAMEMTEDLVQRLGISANEDNPIIGLVGDMIQARHNVPYAASIYETHQEMIAPLRQVREKKKK